MDPRVRLVLWDLPDFLVVQARKVLLVSSVLRDLVDLEVRMERQGQLVLTDAEALLVVQVCLGEMVLMVLRAVWDQRERVAYRVPLDRWV